MDYDAELFALYLLEEFQGIGYGRLLLNTLIKGLKLANYRSIMTWVLEGNSAQSFYERMGGVIIANKITQIGAEKLNSIAIGWKEL
ncbi:N-acetyltransferase [Paenibacillus sp. L3-i20]|uniref:GNAT family N-acetyltransferase n=1 Tax=Paenibacillus sp. L3-i20 TaxID=2905833 RepID=UPI002082A0E8|nr:GNAT family N-acetyltransferase [Paenibacillus sp. L3-i20]GKU77442.1 hypothetical protein L3i20_v218390 [Paenibacillus sp. L3-i20]